MMMKKHLSCVKKISELILLIFLLCNSVMTVNASPQKEYVFLPIRSNNAPHTVSQNVMYHPDDINQFVYLTSEDNKLTVFHLERGIIFENQAYGRLKKRARGGSGSWMTFDRVFDNGLLWLTKDSKVGAVNENNEIVIDFIYDELVSFTQGLAVLVKDGKCGVIDKHGALIAHFEFDIIEEYERGIASAMIGDRQVFIDMVGQVHQNYENPPIFSEGGVARIVNDDKSWFINREGEMICEAVNSLYDNSWHIGKNDLGFLLLNAEGTIICEGLDEYQSFPQKDRKYIPIKKSGKAGIIDLEGNIIVPLEYQDARYDGGNSYVLVPQKGELIIFTEDGTMGSVIEMFSYKGILSKPTRMILSRGNGKYGVVDQFDNIMLPFEYDDIRLLTPKTGVSLYVVSKDGKYGILDVDNNIIAPITYDYILSEAYQKSLIYLTKDSSTGSSDIIDSSGKMILQGVEGKGSGVICSSKGTAVVWAGEQYYLYNENDNSLKPIIDIPPSEGGVRPGRGGSSAEFFIEAYITYGSVEGRDYRFEKNFYYYDENFDLMYNLRGNKIISSSGEIVLESSNNSTPYELTGNRGNGFLALDGNIIGVFEKPLPRAETNNYICLKADNPVINVNGNVDTIEINNYFVRPYIKNGRTMIPLRKIFELLGASVDWNDETQTATAKRGQTEIKITLSDAKMLVNDNTVLLDVPAEIASNRTFIPLRAVSEALGVMVDWNEKTETVIITN